MRPAPDSNVLTWVDNQDSDTLISTAITVAKILYGIAKLPESKRKSALKSAAIAMFQGDIEGRLLPFEEHAAAQYAHIAACREQLGRPTSMADAQIAAIYLVHETKLATRNNADFVDLPLNLINPWYHGPHQK